MIPPGGYSLDIPQGGSISLAALRHQAFLPSAPLAELRRLLPDATVVYDGGWYPAEAALVAGQADLAIVFATKLESEGFDNVDDTLPWGQDAVIAAVAAANPNTVVVLETGNPIAMPWAEDVRAIVQAWYPGQAGGQAIAEILTGAVNPSGRLPVTWPMQMTDAPRTEIPNVGKPFGTPSTVVYDEGSDVGYRWFAREGIAPRYPFGHGLSYTTFEYADLELTGGDTVTAVCTVTNTGDQAGAEVAQLYLTEVDGRPRQRLLDFQRVALDPGQSQRVSLVAEPRVLASYDGPDGCTGTWRIAQGSYSVAVARSATTPALTGEVALAGRTFGR